jgi:CheY-like chemotaxis protein
MVVLTIDDDRDNLDIFCEALNEINPNIDCIKAISAEEALNLLSLANSLPNYIFLDLNMPVINGKECLKMIKLNNKLSEIPIFIYSTSSDSTEIDECKRLGANFLKKAHSHSLLVESLKSIIN